MRFNDVPLEFVSRENYPEFKNTLVDSSVYPDDYDAYLEDIKKRGEAIRSTRRVPTRVEIVPSEFRDWCMRARLLASTRSLQDFVQIRLADQRKR